jgi:hypothetical protein
MTARAAALLATIVLVALCVGRPADAAIGVNWGTVSSHRAPPGVVVDLMRANRISKVKLFDADPSVLRALAGSGIQVMVGVTDGELASIAGSQAAADTWVAQNVSRYVGRGGVDIRCAPVPFLDL